MYVSIRCHRERIQSQTQLLRWVLAAVKVNQCKTNTWCSGIEVHIVEPSVHSVQQNTLVLAGWNDHILLLVPRFTLCTCVWVSHTMCKAIPMLCQSSWLEPQLWCVVFDMIRIKVLISLVGVRSFYCQGACLAYIYTKIEQVNNRVAFFIFLF